MERKLIYLKNKLVLVLIIALLLRLFVSWQNIPLLVERIILDDSFYGYQIAKNIASGNGITYNGIDKTNGFQPFWVFLIVPVFFFTKDIYLAVNIILTIETILDVINIFLIYKLAKYLFNEKIALLSALFWTVNPLIIFQTLSGIDNTIYITFILASLYFYYKIKDNMNYRNIFFLGILLGLTILGRMDGIFLLFVISLHMLEKNRIHRFSNFLILSFVVFLIVLPWLLWSFLNFGTIIQSSGIANYYSSHGIIPFYDMKEPISFSETLSMIFENFLRAFGALMNQLGIIDFNINLITIFISLFFAITFLLSMKFWKKMLIPIIFSIFLLLFYAGYLWGVQIRYMTPIVPFLIIFISAGFYELQNYKSLKISSKLFLVSVFILVVFNGYLQWDRGYFIWQREIYNDAIWVRENTPKDALIGGFASGIPMYFSNRTFINLDGVLNFDAFEAIKNKNIYLYMKSRNVSYWIESSYHNQTFVDRYLKGENIDILKENQWSKVMGEGSENLKLIEVRYGIFRHLRGFNMLVAFFKVKVN